MTQKSWQGDWPVYSASISKCWPVGKALAEFPQVDGVDGNSQVGGDLLERHVAFAPPVFERSRKAGADVTMEF